MTSELYVYSTCMFNFIRIKMKKLIKYYFSFLPGTRKPLLWLELFDSFFFIYCEMDPLRVRLCAWVTTIVCALSSGKGREPSASRVVCLKIENNIIIMWFILQCYHKNKIVIILFRGYKLSQKYCLKALQFNFRRIAAFLQHACMWY